jgi:hypothetical protein
VHGGFKIWIYNGGMCETRLEEISLADDLHFCAINKCLFLVRTKKDLGIFELKK